MFPSWVDADTRLVRRGENLQAALDAAQPGDVLVLEAGAEFTGNFILPVKSGDAPIVVRSTPSDLLPVDGVRIRPSHAPLLARIRSTNAAAALRTAPGAHHWDLRYLEFSANLLGYGDMLQLGDGSSEQNTVEKVPHHLVLRHLYIHGHPLFGQKRCVALNAAHVTIRDSHVSDCKGVGMDTQAIGGWNGLGPYHIENNYLEGAGENVLFGGADPSISELVPDGIVFRRNHVSRPPAWRHPIVGTPSAIAAAPEAGGALAPGLYGYRVMARHPVGQGTVGRSTASAEAVAVLTSAEGTVRITWQAVPGATDYRVYGRTPGAQGVYWTVTTTTFVDTGAAGTAGVVPTTAGTVWSVKNLFELKNARNVIVEGNVFEHHWPQSQPGYAILLTPRNSNGACTWCIVEDVRFENNILRHVSAGINLLGYDIPETPSQQTRGIVVRNNLFHDIGGANGGNGWFVLIGDEPRDVVFDHNTVSHSGGSVVYAYGGTLTAPRQVHGLRFTNNAARHNSYGFGGAFFAYGNGIIEGFFPDAVVKANYLAGGSASRYPAGNLMAGEFELEFVDVSGGDFRLRPASQLRGAATDGGDIGADMGTLLAYVANVEEGSPGMVLVAAPGNLRVLP